MADWHLHRLRYQTALLEAADAVARADEAIARDELRWRRWSAERAALDAARRLNLI